MSATKLPRIADDERVVTAWSEYVSGPGWSNALVHALVAKKGTTDYRTIAFQPNEQTRDMHVLFAATAATTDAMTRAVVDALRPKKHLAAARGTKP